MNPLKHYRIFDEEPCPCGSGMKYSLCCKNGRTPFNEIISDLSKFKLRKH